MDMIRKLWDNPISKKVILVLGGFIVLFIIIILIASCSASRTYTPAEFEAKIVNVTKDYYSRETNKKILPKSDGDYETISLENLVSKGLIRSLDKMLPEGTSCNGDVKIINNNGYYLYLPEIKCSGNYKTKTLYDTLTKSKNIVNTGNGLYAVGDEYIFKGDTPKNFLKLDDLTLRIIRINSDGTIEALDTKNEIGTAWDNRYNIQKSGSYGINDYITNDINSRLKDTLENYYKTGTEFPDNIKPYFITRELCIGKRSINDDILDRNIDCSTKLPKQIFSVINLNDYFNASLDSNCKSYSSESCINYNYFLDIGTTWTVTADKDTSFKAYRISSMGVDLSNTSNLSSIRIVMAFNKEVVITGGKGTETNPYKINTFEK